MESPARVSNESIEISFESDVIHVQAPSRFDFVALSQVMDEIQNGMAGEHQGEQTHKCVIDMAAVEYINSSALGGLLVLRERLGGEKSRIRLSNCANNIKHMFEDVKFNRLF